MVSPTSVSFASATPGLHIVTIGSGANAQRVQVEIFETLNTDAGFLRSYVDRLDACLANWLTAEGRIICLRGEYEVNAYDPDGGFYGRFTGGRPQVAGNVIWSFANGNLDRHVETPGGFVLEGSIADTQGAGIGLQGEATPVRLLRGRNLFTWDGGTLGAEDPGLVGSMFLEGSKAYDDALCEVRPGCLSTNTCTPIQTCGLPTAGNLSNGVVAAMSPERVWLHRWVGTAAELAEVTRPISWAQPPTFRVPPMNAFFEYSGRGVRPIAKNADVALVAAPGGPSHFVVSSERIIANTPEWVVTYVDPFTLRFTPVR